MINITDLDESIWKEITMKFIYIVSINYPKKCLELHIKN